ncbi:uncharacterized protein N7443_003862 [Penicillium atrosanguineum]|uniref:uncharacterized protein n=1 Tax=Penicillium atrosanguineum TaxID=1132637 RepID=UPI0023913CD5|nr:uncharacterized protein N7443_003862 [Penicillium atrosanguineum]KAJ5304202.1 hypothetical protein N7443_003862 [Penicillium atrosanguineum]
MAGSRRSPPLRDQWNADPDRDPRERDRRRGRGSNRDRGRARHRERGRHPRPSDRHFDYPARSPPARASRFGSDLSHAPGDSALDRPPPRGSPGPPSGSNNNRRLDHPRPSSSGGWNDNPSVLLDRDGPASRLDESPFAPPSKRKRTRSPSPHGPRGSYPPGRPSFGKQGERRDRSPSFKNRGRFSGRGAPGRGASRRRSPRGRGRDRRGNDRRRSDIQRPGRSKSPGRDKGSHPSPDRRSRSLSGDYSDRNSRYRSRSASRHSARSAHSRMSTYSSNSRGQDGMNSTQPIQSIMHSTARSPSPPRPIPSYDSSNMSGPSDGPARLQDAFPMHGTRPSDVHNKQRRQPSRPHLDQRPYPTSPNFATPTSSHHGSPPPTSPYNGGRGGRSGQPQFAGSGPSPPYRQDNYNSKNVPSGPQYQNNHGHFDGPLNHQSQGPYNGPPYRGGNSGFRGNHTSQGPGRRFSASGPPPYNNGLSHRGGRGNFNNSQWTASGSRGRGGPQSPPPHSRDSQTPSTRAPSANDPLSPRAPDPGAQFAVTNRDHQREDIRSLPQAEDDGPHDMAPPPRDSNITTPGEKGGKFSFALKPKTTPTLTPKPVPELAQRMVREPPARAPEPKSPRNRLTNGPLPKFNPDARFDRRERDRGRDRKGDRDRRDFRNQQDFRDSRDTRDMRDDRRFDQRRDKRKNDKNVRRPDFRQQERRRDPSPEPPKEPPKQTKIVVRPKPRPMMAKEFADADSVYYRKPGNESVIGAGTYGKVFKGIHVFTQRKVALKKIRMEGEKDGFPVTAVREIKLLQNLRSHNVVSLLEVMVERNECFMVFEYLSHDLTGLINHPTFSLTLAHKKDLAKQMFEGLNYLHHRGVLHRDIKAANILISNQGLLKYADFGLARFFSKSRQLDYTNRVITIWYRPPELLLGETRYGPAVDVWSAACVCMEMFTKKAVFPGEGGELSQLDKLYNCLGTPTRADWPDLVEMPWFQLMRPAERKKRVFEDVYKDVLSPAAMDMIAQVFQYDPAKRPTAEAVLQHPYFLSEEPVSQQAIELEHIEGDWHEFESKALRKEARRAEWQSQKDREKRKAESSVPTSDRDSKRARQEDSDQVSGP